MNWIALNSLEQLEELDQASHQDPVLIFKQSTRCSTSRMALDRLNRNFNSESPSGLKTYFLDLITYRDISNAIAHKFDVEHESPQAIVIKNGKAAYAASHYEIDYGSILKACDN